MGGGGRYGGGKGAMEERRYGVCRRGEGMFSFSGDGGDWVLSTHCEGRGFVLFVLFVLFVWMCGCVDVCECTVHAVLCMSCMSEWLSV